MPGRSTPAALSKGEDTHARIVEHAMLMAGEVGLEGLTIGALASALGLSKSGLFAHFKSKERLQLDVLDAAAEQFRSRVFLPSLAARRGQPRLRAIFQNWLGWAEELPGGCLFLAGALEWDDRQGAVRQRLVDWFDALEQGLTRAVALAIEEAHFRADLDAVQFAFEMHGIAMKFHVDRRLLRSSRAHAQAVRAFDRLLEDAARV